MRAELDDADNKVLLEVENTGNNFGRVLQTQLANGRKKQEAPGFPIFPHSKRILEVPLDAKAEGMLFPTEVSLQFENFKVEEKLHSQSESNLAAGFRIDLGDREHWGKALGHSDAPAIPMRAPGAGDSAGRRANAQVFRVQGGTSTMLNAQGGSVEFKAPKYDGSVDLGYFEGHLRYGAENRYQFHGFTLLTGRRDGPICLADRCVRRQPLFLSARDRRHP